MELAWVPFNSFAAETLLKQTGYLFLSYTNALKVLTSNVWVGLAFLALFAVNLFVAYFQIGLIFMGLRNLLDEEERSAFQFIKKSFKDSGSLIRYARPSKVLFIALYMGFIFPFLRQILKIYYLNKILIPEFIVTYLKTALWMKLSIYALGFLLFLIAVRLMFALPKLFFEHFRLRDAIRYSLEKTKGHLIRYTWQLFWILAKSFLFFLLSSIPILMLQQYADAQSNQIALTAAVVNYCLIKLAYYFMVAYFLIKFVAFLTDSRLSEYRYRKGLPLMRWFILWSLVLSLPLKDLSISICPWKTSL